MKLINRIHQEAHERGIAQQEESHKTAMAHLQDSAPSPVTVKLHSGKTPKQLANGVVVMPDHYYSEKEGIVIHPDDIGADGVWVEA